MLLVLLYMINLALDLPDIASDKYGNVTHCKSNSSGMTQSEIDYFFECDTNCRYRNLVMLRVGMIIIALGVGFILRRSSPATRSEMGRQSSLGLIAVAVWLMAVGNDCASYQYHVLDGLAHDCNPRPQEELIPLVLIMGIYTMLMPGVPFVMASIIGWGVFVASFCTHLSLWMIDDREIFWDVLASQLTREALFNVFGTFVAYEYVQQLRLNYWHTRFLKEAMVVQKEVRKRIHKLTSNTLPAPIVHQIAMGNTSFARVYDQTTVLQADMVGFTVLSSKHPPERVLGILSDIFEEFDTLSEKHRVDKVKTIGDAYIVCAGALCERPRSDDAVRVCRMALAMQEVVRRVATKEKIDIAVRIGIHTGVVTGGIIGTVRFHFDMWGAGVNGAVKMEESGERFRVHISDATHRLVFHRFETEPGEEVPKFGLLTRQGDGRRCWDRMASGWHRDGIWMTSGGMMGW